MFPQKMSADFMVKYSFDGVSGVLDGQADNHGADGVNVVMDDRSRRDSILSELVSQQISYVVPIDVLLYVLRSFLYCQVVALFQDLPVHYL